MNKLFWLIAGIAVGVTVAKQIQDNPQAKKAYEDAKASLQEFGDAVAEGYREREAELVAPSRKTGSKTARKSSANASSRSSAKRPAAKSKPAGK